jgi:hypothetical protein
MSQLHFVTRIIHGQERAALAEAAKRVDSAWMPFEFASTRPARRRNSTVTVRPLMGYMFCTATAAQRDHLMRLRGVMAPVWYLPEQHLARIEAYKREVEAAFEANREARQANARQFHCRFKRGQTVMLRMKGLDLFRGKFRAINPDGTYDIEGPFSRITAEPGSVEAA